MGLRQARSQISLECQLPKATFHLQVTINKKNHEAAQDHAAVGIPGAAWALLSALIPNSLMACAVSPLVDAVSVRPAAQGLAVIAVLPES